MIILTELTRLGELKAIASECEQAVETTDSFELRAALYLVAAHFRSRARVLAKGVERFHQINRGRFLR